MILANSFTLRNSYKLVFPHTATSYCLGMDYKEARLENLRLLVAEFGSMAAVARAADTNEKYLWQILNKVPQRGTARAVGDKLARKLEIGCGKPEGWMDAPHDAAMAPEDGALLEDIRAELQGRDVPPHVRQAIMTLLHTAPRKDGDGPANDDCEGNPAQRRPAG